MIKTSQRYKESIKKPPLKINKKSGKFFKKSIDNNANSFVASKIIKEKVTMSVEEYRVEKVGGLGVDTSFGKLGELFRDLENEIIITLPPWLQRKLQEDEWMGKGFKKSKRYFCSAVKGTLRFEPFILVKIDLLTDELEKYRRLVDNEEEKEEIDETLKYIAKYQNAKYVIIDGQSRGYLSISNFFKNKFHFDESYTLRRISKDTGHMIEEYNLKNRFYKDMPEWVRIHLDDLFYIKNIISSGSLKDIVKGLISKQEGVIWLEFQKLYAEYAFQPIFTRLRKVITKPIETFYEKKLKDYGKPFYSSVNGLELAVTNCLLYLRDKSVPDLHKIARTCEGKDTTPSKSKFSTLIGYLDEFRKYYGSIKSKNKVKLKLWFTYALFRNLIDNGEKVDEYYNNFGLNSSFKILINNKFCEWFLRQDIDLLSKVSPDSNRHWIKRTTTAGKEVWDKVEGGYPASYGGDNADTLRDRLYWLSQMLLKDKQKLIDDGIICVKTEMPSSIDVISYNNHKDAEGNSVDYRIPLDNGHRNPVSKTGDNSLTNIVPQIPKHNKQYSDSEIIE